MSDFAASAVRRFYLNNWIPIGSLATLLAVCLALTDFYVQVDSELLKELGPPIALAVVAHLGLSNQWIRLSYTLGTIAQLKLLYPVATSLTFVAATAQLPLQDDYLAYADRMFGLDWRSYYSFFINDHPSSIPYLYFGYAMIAWPMFGIPIILGASGHHLRLQQFVLACMITIIVTGLISVVTPAMGTFLEYGITPDISKFNPSGYIAQVQRLPLVRDGSLRILSPATLGGIISFPSFHAAAAVLSLWALWSVWWMRPLALIANVSMLVATPLGGGHYFVDVFAGIFLAVSAISLARLIGNLSVRATSISTMRVASVIA
jgi:PAP2 superfamily